MQKRRCGICLIVFFALFLTCVCLPFSVKTTCSADENILKLHFIDVGQGDAIFVELPDNKTMLIDAGSTNSGEVVSNYIKNLGVTQIDYLIATHADEDHIGGFVKVFEEFEVSTIYRPFTPCSNVNSGFVDELYLNYSSTINLDFMEDSLVYANFLKAVYDEQCGGELSTIKVCSSNEHILSSSAEAPYLVSFYMPRAKSVFNTARIVGGYTVDLTSEDNDTSAVVGITTSLQKYLFMGDLTTDGETKMLSSISDLEKEQISSVSVLKVAHHGSQYSSSEEFLNIVKPTYAVIMVGKNDYGHPSSDVLDALTNLGSVVYRTDKYGNIVVGETKINLVEVKTSKTPKTYKDYMWIFYTILGIIVVGVITVIILNPIAKKKKILWYKRDNNLKNC